MTGARIQGSASELRTIFERLTLPKGSDHLFRELYLRFREDGKVMCAVQDERKSAFLQAVFQPENVDADDTKVKFDATELMDFLGRFGDDQVTIEFSGSGTITIRSHTKESIIHEVDVKMPVPKTLPSMEDGVVVWKGGTRKSDTVATMDVDELLGVVRDASTLDVADFPLSFQQDKSAASLVATDGTGNRITTELNAKVQGGPADTVVGRPLVHVVANLSGEVEVHTVGADDTDWPIAIRKKTEAGTFLYIVTSRAEA